MLFGEYHFRGVLEDDAVLPPFKGSTFRGVFGRALKEVTCALRHQECPACLLRNQCVYTRVFEYPPDLLPRGAPTPPHPFVIEPPLTPRTHFFRGETFEFTLLLFGFANQCLPYFVYAFEQMGRIGIGRRLEGRRARFRLLSVSTSEGESIYHFRDRALEGDRTAPLTWEALAAGRPVEKLTLELLTPLRLKFQNRLQAELPFHVLLRAALRRLSTLSQYFGQGEPPLDYKGLIARAQEVAVAESSLSWTDWQRYSHRQDRAMLLGGLTGRVTYVGALTEFVPFLRFVEKVHLGKATTFGLGKIALSNPSHKGLDHEGR
ncbi:MAG: CRISPR system precrRNA processing endoribonuclease RAMP protein Cas6 [Deltaproteobacteria bacterium]|nr:CRISPR system precrRNA processing endoribonuclease RAMP protein Cas6 [Deltaproteobacteria bacterium]MBW1990888.1 CRISPR system precrRNA processing endoribonuclease RAMP protein Cas6 [Deltaproteobacteria bacterium]